MESLKLDKNGIYEYQQNRDPYLLIDFAEEVIPGVSAKGFKDFRIDEWFFECHFPGDPNVPGMLQIEALVQMCALTVLTLPGNKGKVAYLISADNMKLSKKIVPGDRLYIDTKLLSWKRGVGRCSGKGLVDGDVACQADFTIVMPNILDEYRVLPRKQVKE
ncbi:MAG: 3-hydroxyacyl-ACP dehydratase FabZ family protein [Anaerolineales bacterium]|jgi:3-hydroxyacyl-[acyl-carrier-protein] dehydratase|nr:3-hydroxyacyl-ACP dehydratase FabZ family protein [Anaerolineales bacterium]|tara:strand:+ start:1301 stop:1783 length:483 start_codon:yes stop_codon:yes gene_type:complete